MNDSIVPNDLFVLTSMLIMNLWFMVGLLATRPTAAGAAIALAMFWAFLTLKAIRS